MSKCSRVVAATSYNVCEVAIERQVFIERDAQKLYGWAERNIRASDVNSSWSDDIHYAISLYVFEAKMKFYLLTQT